MRGWPVLFSGLAWIILAADASYCAMSNAQDHLVVKQLPLRGRLPVLYWWAERGLVRYVREPDGEYGILEPKTARERAARLWALVGTSSGGDPADERARLAGFLRQFEAVIDLAEAQGPPLAGIDSVRHWKAKRPVSIIVPPSWERVGTGGAS